MALPTGNQMFKCLRLCESVHSNQDSQKDRKHKSHVFPTMWEDYTTICMNDRKKECLGKGVPAGGRKGMGREGEE